MTSIGDEGGRSQKNDICSAVHISTISQNVGSMIILITSLTPTCERAIKEAVKNGVFVAHLKITWLFEYFYLLFLL